MTTTFKDVDERIRETVRMRDELADALNEALDWLGTESGDDGFEPDAQEHYDRLVAVLTKATKFRQGVV